jgi:HK97 family phage major capsid protein
MLFGDFKQFLIVDRIGMTVEMVPTVVNPLNGLPTGSRGVYAIWMNNSKILVPDAFRRLVNGH